MSDSCGQSNSLVFGADLMDRVATTRPLAISATPTASVLLHEGFDVASDITRLVSEGYITFIFNFAHTYVPYTSQVLYTQYHLQTFDSQNE